MFNIRTLIYEEYDCTHVHSAVVLTHTSHLALVHLGFALLSSKVNDERQAGTRIDRWHLIDGVLTLNCSDDDEPVEVRVVEGQYEPKIAPEPAQPAAQDLRHHHDVIDLNSDEVKYTLN